MQIHVVILHVKEKKPVVCNKKMLGQTLAWNEINKQLVAHKKKNTQWGAEQTDYLPIYEAN